ncbi:MAG: ankyrin repeat domain-containing protein, partial [Pseudomonadota bacterium]|nr:ankyrin repeat domain-containing protein [Pseudomonadota bacterium]
VEVGMDVNVLTRDHGATPVFYAVENGCLEVVQYLHEMGANMFAEDDKGNACLHLCADGIHVLNVIDYLCDTVGLDINKPNKEGETPFSLAAKIGYSHIAYYLNVEKGANYVPIEGLKFRLQYDYSWIDEYERTPISAVCLWLREHGVKLSDSSLYEYIFKYSSDVRKMLNDVRCLIRAGVNINVQDERGSNLLHYAVNVLTRNHDNERSELITLLCEAKVDVNLLNQTGLTPLMQALCMGHANLASIILAHGGVVNAQSMRLNDLVLLGNAFNGIVAILEQHQLKDKLYKSMLQRVLFILQHHADSICSQDKDKLNTRLIEQVKNIFAKNNFIKKTLHQRWRLTLAYQHYLSRDPLRQPQFAVEFLAVGSLSAVELNKILNGEHAMIKHEMAEAFLSDILKLRNDFNNSFVVDMLYFCLENLNQEQIFMLAGPLDLTNIPQPVSGGKKIIELAHKFFDVSLSWDDEAATKICCYAMVLLLLTQDKQVDCGLLAMQLLTKLINFESASVRLSGALPEITEQQKQALIECIITNIGHNNIRPLLETALHCSAEEEMNVAGKRVKMTEQNDQGSAEKKPKNDLNDDSFRMGF